MNFKREMVRFIKDEIPIEILDLGLRDFKQFRRSLNIDVLIDKNILSGMYQDMSISRGVKVNLPVNKLNVVYSNETETVFEIPNTLYRDRKLVAVREFISGGTINDYTSQQRTPINDLNSTTGSTIFGVFDAGAEAISDREIYIEKELSSLIDGEFVVLLSYGTDLREINPHYYMAFGELAILKAKWWLYNKLYIKLEKGSLYHGHDITTIREIISDYRDAGKEYRETMNTKGSKMLFMNDSRSNKEFIGLHFDSRL